MKLIFIHGWGFDARFLDQLSPLLGQFQQQRVDLGYLGAEPNDIESRGNILIGHSLGFVLGMQHTDWTGYIAINSFPHFLNCVPAVVLHKMQKQLAADPQRTLSDFYKLIGATPPSATNLNMPRLAQGLNDLRDVDITATLRDWKKPALVLASENDPLVPLAVSQSMPAQQTLHPSAGHMLPQNDPAWCADAITSFLRQHFP